MWSIRKFFITIVKVSLSMRALREEKRLNAIALLQHGHSTREMSKLLGISQSTCSRICKVRVSHVEPSRGGHPRSITLAQRRACVKAITIGGLDTNVDMRNVLTKGHFTLWWKKYTKTWLFKARNGMPEKMKR